MGVLRSHYFQNKYVNQSKLLSDVEILLHISSKEYNNMCRAMHDNYGMTDPVNCFGLICLFGF